MKKVLYHISRIFVGATFVFSGFVKVVDPMGTAIKFNDYFNFAFGLPQLTFLSLPLSLLMCAVELSVGLLLLFDLVPKIATWAATLLMLFFTPLTLYLAIANPVSDCGCFGDAVKLTNWETFFKNVIIDVFVVMIFLWKKQFPAKIKLRTRQIISTVIVLLVFGFELYNYSYLPIIDFRPYKVGNNITKMMEIPEDAEKSVFETTFIYKNSETGEEKEFNQDNYPWDDSTWVWVESKNILVKQGYVPPIHDFELVDLNGTDQTQNLLNIDDTVILVVVYSLEEINKKRIEKTQNFIDNFKQKRPQTQVFCVSSSDDDIISETIDKYDLNEWVFCKTDEVTLKTIIRSSPGIVLLQKGTILEKLHHHSFSERKLESILK